MLDTSHGRYDQAAACRADEALRIVATTGAAVRSRCAIACSSNRPGYARAQDAAAVDDALAEIATPPYAAQQPLRVLEVARETLQSERASRSGA
jgi:hypothetical protein